MVAEEMAWIKLPDGEYAIVELFGHQTLVGLVGEVERFGAKMLEIRCLFNGTMLDSVFHGGSAIYRFTPCSKKVAWEKHPKQPYQLPESIRATVPDLLLQNVSHTIDRDEDGNEHFYDDR